MFDCTQRRFENAAQHEKDINSGQAKVNTKKHYLGQHIGWLMKLLRDLLYLIHIPFPLLLFPNPFSYPKQNS
jgi:hypothetical protein